MLEVRGLRAWRFDEKKTGGLDKVVTPPYDVIGPGERDALAETSPYNMVHLILPRAHGGRSPYEDAGRRFRDWTAQGILVQDRQDSLYLLEQHFNDLDGKPCVRRGFFGLVRIPEPGEQTILGHERTFDKPVADRLALTEATKANLGVVFSLYGDPERRLAGLFTEAGARPPDGEARTIDGVRQRAWRVPYREDVTAFFRDKTLYIADGHHRFLTAQTYRDRMRAQGHGPGPHAWEFVLMAFIAFEDAGLKIYPPHRVVPLLENIDPGAFLAALETWFEVTPVEEGLRDAVANDTGPCTIGLALHRRGNYLLRLRDEDRTALLGDDRAPAWRNLDVAVLHRGILEKILALPPETEFQYQKDADLALHAVRKGAASMAFILRATKPEQIRACAGAGERMPQKATYFFPKVPSGLVIHRLG